MKKEDPRIKWMYIEMEKSWTKLVNLILLDGWVVTILQNHIEKLWTKFLYPQGHIDTPFGLQGKGGKDDLLLGCNKHVGNKQSMGCIVL